MSESKLDHKQCNGFFGKGGSSKERGLVGTKVDLDIKVHKL